MIFQISALVIEDTQRMTVQLSQGQNTCMFVISDVVMDRSC